MLLTKIGLTLDLKASSREAQHEFIGKFNVKWLLFSHTFSFGEPEEKEGWPESGVKKEEKGKEGRKEDREAEREAERGVERDIEREDKREREKGAERGAESGEERGAERETKKREKGEFGEKEVIKEFGNKKGVIKEIKKEKKEAKKEKKEAKKEKKYGEFKEKFYWGLRAFRILRQPLFRFFSDLLRGINIRHLDAYMVFGLPDPADTGMVCGFLHGLAGIIYSRCRKCRVCIEPVFLDPMLDFRGDAQISIKIYSLIFPIIKFIINRRTLYFTYLIIKEKVKGHLKGRSQAL
ncbi:DUF2953 domain-containing protein [Methanosarcina sp. KYL-1]|uniref:DUF2953 domain-containing protein n=1 Tax=Methanosarcina sp. KYL-1 TaxID=2602068 RepID=UPI0021013EAF|nr:DUF2953 domain-containing protein [Methanosarcina sp. KYL-1]